MRKSNFDRLLELYVTHQTTETETRKIEAFIDVMEARRAWWISDETEELLCKAILDKRVSPEGISKIASRLL